MNATQPLLQPYRMGEYQLANRVVMADQLRAATGASRMRRAGSSPVLSLPADIVFVLG